MLKCDLPQENVLSLMAFFDMGETIDFLPDCNCVRVIKPCEQLNKFFRIPHKCSHSPLAHELEKKFVLVGTLIVDSYADK